MLRIKLVIISIDRIDSYTCSTVFQLDGWVIACFSLPFFHRLILSFSLMLFECRAHVRRTTGDIHMHKTNGTGRGRSVFYSFYVFFFSFLLCGQQVPFALVLILFFIRNAFTQITQNNGNIDALRPIKCVPNGAQCSQKTHKLYNTLAENVGHNKNIVISLFLFLFLCHAQTHTHAAYMQTHTTKSLENDTGH